MRLHVVDGTYELYRAHFSKRPEHRDAQGRPAKAVAAFAASLLALLHDAEETVTHIAVAFDNPIRSFRNELFEGYKTDEGVPPELRAQFDGAEEATRALGVVAWSMSTFEADDALATAAVRFATEVEQVRILTPDKDLHQVVAGSRIVQVDRVRRRVIDEAAVRAQWGIAPSLMADLLALTGDPADGVPGLPGFGPKTAAVLLSAFGSLDAIPDDGAQWPASVRGAARLAPVLRARRADARLYRELTRLRLDVPLGGGLDALRFDGTPRARFLAFCEEYKLRTLAERPTRWLP